LLAKIIKQAKSLYIKTEKINKDVSEQIIKKCRKNYLDKYQ